MEEPVILDDVTQWIAEGETRAAEKGPKQAVEYYRFLSKKWEALIGKGAVVDDTGALTLVRNDNLRAALRVVYDVFARKAKRGANRINEALAAEILEAISASNTVQARPPHRRQTAT